MRDFIAAVALASPCGLTCFATDFAGLWRADAFAPAAACGDGMAIARVATRMAIRPMDPQSPALRYRRPFFAHPGAAGPRGAAIPSLDVLIPEPSGGAPWRL